MEEFDQPDDFGGGPEGLGVADTASVEYGDYWGTDESFTWYFPDGKQFITYKKMNEGERVRFQQKINRDITVERQTGNARIKADPGTERHALLAESITGWSLVRRTDKGFEQVPFSIGTPGATFNQWLQKADPKLVSDLEKEIRRINPWLTADLTVEDIDKQIEDLQEMREAAEKRESGN